jgi:hypothetical protein
VSSSHRSIGSPSASALENHDRRADSYLTKNSKFGSAFGARSFPVVGRPPNR